MWDLDQSVMAQGSLTTELKARVRHRTMGGGVRDRHVGAFRLTCSLLARIASSPLTVSKLGDAVVLGVASPLVMA